jgi:transcriptional regulator with XRE-family HTH domain
MISKIAEKLRDPEYRKSFVASQINVGIPFQIRALLKSRPGWTQATLAERTGMLQPRISGLMTPGKTRPNIETLRRVAEAFDCGLIVRFAPFSELARWSEDFDPETFSAPAFPEDTGFIDRPGPRSEFIPPESYPQAVNQIAPSSTTTKARRRGRLISIADGGQTTSVPFFQTELRSIEHAR